MACLSIQKAAPDVEKSIIDAVTAEVEKKKCDAPPGLVEQWELQLNNLRDSAVPDLEIVIMPGYMGASCKLFVLTFH